MSVSVSSKSGLVGGGAPAGGSAEALAALACEIEWRRARLCKEEADKEKESGGRMSGREKERAKEREKGAMRQAMEHAADALKFDDGSYGKLWNGGWGL
jgi:hypothetical protein